MNVLNEVHAAFTNYMQQEGRHPTHVLLTRSAWQQLLKDPMVEGIFNSETIMKIEKAAILGMNIVITTGDDVIIKVGRIL